MERVKIKVKERLEKGKGPAGRWRKQGSIPAVVYSQGFNMPLTVGVESMKALKSIHFSESAIVDMEIEGREKTEPIAVLIKAVQHNPLTEAVEHIDFLKVSLKDKIRVHVPIVLKGEAKGAKEEGGVLNQVVREIELEGLPLDIPEHIEIDVSGLTIGHSIHADQLVLPEGVKPIIDPKSTLVSIVDKTEEEEPKEEEGQEKEPEVLKEKKEAEAAEGEKKPSKEAKQG